MDDLRAKGAVFVEELDECPADRPVIFSAHGVPKAVPAEAERRQMVYVDATCPLVSKVHVEAERHHAAGRHIILIGHAGHPEVIGTMGYVDALREVSREGDQYSWWPDSEQAEMLNLGWRFDYQLLTPGMRRIVRNAKMPRQPRFSQHAPLIVDYDWLLSV